MRTPLLCLFTLAAALSACSDAQDTASSSDKKPPPKATTYANVAVNPRASAATAKQRDEVVIQENKLVFPASGNDALLKKKAGDILVGDRSKKGNNPYGFMVKIVSVSKVGDSIEVVTEPAYLNEVLIGKFELVTGPDDLVPMTDAELGIKPASDGALNVPGLNPQAEASVSLDMGKEVKDLKLFEVKIGAMDLPLAKGKLGVSLAGAAKVNEASFRFKPTMRIGAEIDVPGGFWDKFDPSNYLQEFHVIASGEVSTKLVLGGSVALTVESAPDSLKKDQANSESFKNLANTMSQKFKSLNPPSSFTLPLGRLSFASAIPAGPIIIPVTYEFEIQLACGATLAGGMEGEVGFSGSSAAEFGTIYENGSGWRPVKSFDMQLTKIGPNYKANGSAEFKCALEPKLATKLAGFAGPFIKVSGSIALKGEYKEECPPNNKEGDPTPTLGASLDAGFDVSLGAEAKFNILSKEIKLAEASFSLYNKSWNLWKTEPPLQLPQSWAIGYCQGEQPVNQGGNGGSAGSGGSGGSTTAGSGGSSAGSGGSSTAGSGGGGGSGGSSQAGSGGSSTAGSGGGGSGGSSGQGGSSGSGGSSSQGECNNGVLNGNEDCDGNNFGGKTCKSVTLNDNATGNLVCTDTCKIDASGCDIGASCGDVCTETETPQKADCGSCQQQVCAANEYCCLISWDLLCVEAAKSLCGMCN